MKTTLKIQFKEFIQAALETLKKSRYPDLDPTSVKFMKHYNSEADGECYEIPDYIELEIEL